MRFRRQTTEQFWALKDATFEVPQGEVVGIIGHNGAGKSTLLKILSRIVEPTGGEAFLRGRLGSLLEVGTGFHPDLTGRENIFLNGAMLGMPRSLVQRQFDNIVEFSGVEQFLDTPVKRYSSGMYVRLAFSIAAHLDCDVLIVDEVLAVGDEAFQRKCLGKMNEVVGQGRTVLFVSHNMSAVTALTSRSLVFEHGRLVFDGATDWRHRAISGPGDRGAAGVRCAAASDRTGRHAGGRADFAGGPDSAARRAARSRSLKSRPRGASTGTRLHRHSCEPAGPVLRTGVGLRFREAPLSIGRALSAGLPFSTTPAGSRSICSPSRLRRATRRPA